MLMLVSSCVVVEMMVVSIASVWHMLMMVLQCSSRVVVALLLLHLVMKGRSSGITRRVLMAVLGMRM